MPSMMLPCYPANSIFFATLPALLMNTTDPSAVPSPAPSSSPAAPSAPSPAQAARALLKQLQEQFPVFRDCLPLAIGIDKQLLARTPELNRKALRMALGIHTNSLRYLKAMEKATARFDLDGKQADDVTDAHRAHASQTLQERIRKNAEFQKAKRKAEETQRKAEEAERKAAEIERQRADKLNQLAAKFSKHS